MIALLLALPAALAHSGPFSLDRISTNGDTIWGITEGWGAIVSHDDGATWSWVCEEGLIPEGAGAATLLYDVDALADGSAMLSAVGGVFHLDDACGLTTLTGIPEDVTVGGALLRDGASWLAALRSPTAAGVYRCDTTTCAPTALVGPDFAVHAIVRDGSTFWASSTVQSTITGGLWRSPDGAAWEQVYAWPDGSRVPYVLSASGDRLLVWALAWDIGDTSGLLRSADGGQTWTEVVSFGDYTLPAASLLAPAADGRMRVGDTRRTVYQSTDDGVSWTLVEADDPTHVSLRCVSDDQDYACADHYVDGYDVGRVDGLDVTMVSCLDEATIVPCLKEACGRAYTDFLEQGSYGGQACRDPGPDSGGDTGGDTGGGDDDGPCGCGGSSGAASVGLLAGLALVVRRRARG